MVGVAESSPADKAAGEADERVVKFGAALRGLASTRVARAGSTGENDFRYAAADNSEDEAADG
jgi:hypothetical protein